MKHLSFDYSLPESAQITDYIYGVTGIAKAYLKAYQVTRNSTYLGICIKSMSWVLNQTEYTSNDTNGLRRILYSQDPSYPYYFTGYQSGASGIGDFLLTLYNVTNQADYLLYAKQFANWLIFQEEGKGYWENFNAVDYLTNQETNNWEGTFLGYSAGSSGVGIFLMDLFTKTNDTRYLGPVERIKNFLINNSITNGTELYWKDQIKGNFENRTDTGLSTGVAGIGLFFIKYYQFFGTSEILSTLNGILNFYNAITTSDGLVPYLIGATNVIYDSSYFDGLTGISLYFLEVNKTILDQPLFSTTILNNIQNFTFSNTKNFYALYLNNALVSTKPISSNSANYSQTLTSYETSHSKTASFSYLTFSVILILAITGIKRRIRNKK